MDLALELSAEIINADSQQVYRHMDIGTGKPTAEQRQRVPHHLIDIIGPDGEFDAAVFRRLAIERAKEIWAQKKRVIVCGGTGLYIRALTHGLFIGPSRDPAIRQRLEAEAEQKGLGALYERLREVDPDATAAIHPNDRQRIIRALEVFELTGKRMTHWQREHAFREGPFELFKIGLNRDRQELYDLINKRCAAMVERGLVEELRGLVEKGYRLELESLQSIGYRHMGLYLRGLMSIDEAIALMQRDTRRLAKRQLTWFRADKDIRWFHPEEGRAEIHRAARLFFEESL